MSFPLTFGNFLSPMETKNNEFPSSALPEEQADLSKTELRKKKVESLRKIAREVVGSGSWIASARKSTLVSAILHGQEYAEIDRPPTRPSPRLSELSQRTFSRRCSPSRRRLASHQKSCVALGRKMPPRESRQNGSQSTLRAWTTPCKPLRALCRISSRSSGAGRKCSMR